MKLSMLKEWEKTATDEKRGFRVHFEVRQGGMLAGDYMPDHDEEALPDVNAAWLLADTISACAPDSIVNIYPVDGRFVPVSDYKVGLKRKYPA